MVEVRLSLAREVCTENCVTNYVFLPDIMRGSDRTWLCQKLLTCRPACLNFARPKNFGMWYYRECDIYSWRYIKFCMLSKRFSLPIGHTTLCGHIVIKVAVTKKYVIENYSVWTFSRWESISSSCDKWYMENDINVGAVLLIGCCSCYSRDGPVPDQALHRGIQLQQWWVYLSGGSYGLLPLKGEPRTVWYWVINYIC